MAYNQRRAEAQEAGAGAHDAKAEGGGAHADRFDPHSVFYDEDLAEEYAHVGGRQREEDVGVLPYACRRCSLSSLCCLCPAWLAARFCQLSALYVLLYVIWLLLISLLYFPCFLLSALFTCVCVRACTATCDPKLPRAFFN